MGFLRIDFETYSECDIKECGAWIYSRHPSTEILCMAWAEDDSPVNIWFPGDPLPEWVKDTSLVNGIEAHNASFEISIWRNVGQPKHGFGEAPLFKWYDTMAQAGMCALPLNLEECSAALHLPFQKDKEGARIMLQLSKPRTPSKTRPETRMVPGKYPDWDVKFARLYDYCKNDVEVQRAISKRLPTLPPLERKYYLLTEAINLRGIPVDLPLVKKAYSLLQDYISYSKGRVKEITEGKLTTVNTVAKLLEFLQERGVAITDVRSGTLENLLNSRALDHDAVAKEVVQLRLSTGKSSTAKLAKLIAMCDTDKRIRHNMVYHGAGTGRVAGRGVQATNLPRGYFDADYPEEMLEACNDIATMTLKQLIDKYSNFVGKNGKPNPLTPLDVISSCIRGMFMAGPGKYILAADYSNIEGRVNAWVAGESWKLKAFREFDAGTGPDLYKVTAAGILHKQAADVSKNERQVYGKVPELALGFGGGLGAFQNMAKVYNVQLPDEQIKSIVSEYRKVNSRITASWYAGERAAVKSMTLKNTWVPVEGLAVDIAFKYDTSIDFLLMRLPSGRCLYYYEPRLIEKDTPWGSKALAVCCTGVNPLTKKLGREDLYSGKYCENWTQAIARDIMYNGMLRCELAGYPQILSVYDEAVAEHANSNIEQMEKELCTLPDWAKGLPVAAEGFAEKRYRK